MRMMCVDRGYMSIISLINTVRDYKNTNVSNFRV